MTDKQAGGTNPTPDKGLTRCRRTGQDFSSEEHQRCPYCFGSEAKIETGNHDDFCDYDPNKDPISFGFPDNGSHYRRG